MNTFKNVVNINRFKTPKWLCRFALKAQRIQLRTGIINHHPFRFKAGDKKITLTPKEGVGALSPYDYNTNPTKTER